MTPLKDIISKDDRLVHYFQTSLREKIDLDPDMFFQVLDKYKEYIYLQHGVVCTSYLSFLFQTLGLMNPGSFFMRPYSILHPNNFTFDHSVLSCSYIQNNKKGG